MAIFFLLSCQCSPETKLKISLFLELPNQKLTLLKRVYYKLKNEDESRENRESMERKYLENF
jgi:hypothetical protein